ncbi:PaaI family thioesterase [Polynucleobacter sp. MWH-HuK1]|uniref:PaaI family thioesterase n=1 Tax=Polynucleobacter sp. MWH-HuK1 TaxID=1743158 RepID=UPI001C0B4DE4|nr:hotdog domain-containing protein [Polynucleobacter sp. MWH-HuK1]MBU3565213.1 PaaI family thioesterase [Polynucleobacter sp. MWH-HuK1]
MNEPFQDKYADEYSHCYGCGKNNPAGHKLKSYWNGVDTIAKFTVERKYSGGVPDHVYGGMIASLFDCHGTASAAAFSNRLIKEGVGESKELIRFVTGSLAVKFLRPTPIGVELTINGSLKSIVGRKIEVVMTLFANSIECASAEMLAIQI